MNSLNVLITGAGANFNPDLIRCLKDNGEREIKVVATDCIDDGFTKSYSDVFRLVPRVGDDSFVSEMLRVCKEERVDILLPTIDDEIPLLIKDTDKFKHIGTTISASNIHSVNVCMNKRKLYDVMQKFGIPTPNYRRIENVESIKSVVQSLGYPDKPVCIKNTNLAGSRGIRIIDESKSMYDLIMHEKPNSLYASLQQVVDAFKGHELPDMYAMEYLPGLEYSVDVLADKGKVRYVCGRTSTNVVASIPQNARLKRDDYAYDICEKIISVLSIDGNADFDFKCDQQGKPVLLECNPRLAATMAIFKEGGLNLPYLRVKQLIGEELPQINVNYNVQMKRMFKEYYI